MPGVRAKAARSVHARQVRRIPAFGPDCPPAQPTRMINGTGTMASSRRLQGLRGKIDVAPGELRFRQRATHQVALQDIAAQQAQQLHLLLFLHTFRDDLQ